MYRYVPSQDASDPCPEVKPSDGLLDIAILVAKVVVLATSIKTPAWYSSQPVQFRAGNVGTYTATCSMPGPTTILEGVAPT